MNPKARKRVFNQLYEAVSYLHQSKNLIHGDIDVKNIRLTSLDDNFVVKVIDFNWF